MEDPATGNVRVLSADNSQKKICVADVNDMEVCQEVLSSGNAVCSEKSQSLQGWMGLVIRPIRSINLKVIKVWVLRALKALRDLKFRNA